MNRLLALGLTAIGLNFFQVGQAQAQTAVQGFLTVTVSVILTTPIPSGGFVGCDAQIQFVDNATTSILTKNNEESVTVGVVSGGIATCTMVMPYYWDLVTPATDVVYVTYGAAILPAGATLINGQLSGAPPMRSGGHEFPPKTGVPVTGTHWTLHGTMRL